MKTIRLVLSAVMVFSALHMAFGQPFLKASLAMPVLYGGYLFLFAERPVITGTGMRSALRVLFSVVTFAVSIWVLKAGVQAEHLIMGISVFMGGAGISFAMVMGRIPGKGHSAE